MTLEKATPHRGVSVDENRLKGNYAQHFAATWLSRRCLVRPVAEGTDVGIDLYCESVNGQSPFLHFWVQVKAVNETHLSDDEEEASCSFETRHLKYWSQQPIPMFAFLLPIKEWPPTSSPKRIYGIRITEHILRNGIPSQDRITLRTREYFLGEKLEQDLSTFVDKVVPYTTSIMHLARGMIPPIPTLPEMERSFRNKRYPDFFDELYIRYAPLILDTILDNSSLVGISALKFEDATGSDEIRTIRKRFEAIVSLFEEEKLHEMAFSFLAIAACAEGNRERVKELIEKACKQVDQDPELSELEKRERIERIRSFPDELRKMEFKHLSGCSE